MSHFETLAQKEPTQGSEPSAGRILGLSLGRAFGLSLLCLVVAGIIHAPAFRAPLSGRDRAIIAGVDDREIPGMTSPCGNLKSEAIGPTFRKFERLAGATSAPRFHLLGTLLATTLAVIAAALTATFGEGAKVRRFLVGFLLMSALAAMTEMTVSVRGHVVLCAANLIGGLLLLGIHRPNILTLGIFPALSGWVLGGEAAVAVAGAGLVAAMASRTKLSHITTGAAGAAALVGIVTAFLSRPDGIAFDLRSSLAVTFAWLVPDVSASHSEVFRSVIFGWSIALPLALLAPLILAARRASDASRVLRSVITALALGVVAVLLRNGPPNAAAAASIAGAVLSLGVACAVGLGRLAEMPRTEYAALGLLVAASGGAFLVQTHAARQTRIAMESPVQAALMAQTRALETIAPTDLRLFNLPRGNPKLAPELETAARLAEGSGAFERRVRTHARDAYDLAPAELLEVDRPTLLVEWRPAAFFASGTEPTGWVLAPFLATKGVAPEDQVKLISPANDARISTARPETIEEDMTFIFELGPDVELGGDRRIVFYGFYAGGFSPKGKNLVAARVLEDGVFRIEELDGGRRRYHWRPAIRPGEGHDGVMFDDPDLDIAGKPFWWTVGIVDGAHGAACDGKHEEAESGSAELIAPALVAQTRRIRFTAPVPTAKLNSPGR